MSDMHIVLQFRKTMVLSLSCYIWNFANGTKSKLLHMELYKWYFFLLLTELALGIPFLKEKQTNAHYVQKTFKFEMTYRPMRRVY